SIVYGVRNDRTTDSFFKRQTASMFYKLMVMLGVKTIPNHADFRLMDNRAVTEMLNFGESNLFLRGIVPLVGFNHSKVYYKRNEREAGETKYPLKKMIRFAWEGISSFSTKPMRIILFLGVYTFLFSLGVATWSFITFLQDKTIPGWVSTMLPISIIGGVQVISIGIIGEYIGKIYNEVKKRPRFIIDKTLVK
ncbi:MAG: glycosyltransferase, partial [Bacteroidales bacterium]|nr:glycosyltransferase [Bacteroidales bacterium]